MKSAEQDLRHMLVQQSSALFRRFEALEEKIAQNLLPFTTPPGFTDHGLKHARAVQDNLRRLLPRTMPEPLNAFELFALLLSSMLHDVGMALSEFADEPFSDMRLTHYTRSRDFVVEHHEALGLSEHEALVVGEICRAHGVPTLDYLQGRLFSLAKHGIVRVPLLSALLRLADYLDLTADRAPAILASARIIPADSQAHWDLHASISDVIIVNDPSWDIRIVSVPSDGATESRLYELRNAIDAELEKISPVLRSAGIFFKRVDLVLNKTLLERGQRSRKNPFLRLAAFGPRDVDLFAGRDMEINQLIEKITGRKLIVLIGESGVGKTSLVEAGVVPRLKDYAYRVVRFSFQNDPVASLAEGLVALPPLRTTPDRGRAQCSPPDLLARIRSALHCNKKRTARLLIIGDHLEQMFTTQIPAPRRAMFLQQMARVLGNTRGEVCFLFCMRQDYLPDLYDLSLELPELYERANTFRLQRLSRENGKQVLERASSYASVKMADAVIKRVLDDLCYEGEGMIYPPFLQIVGYSLYANIGKLRLSGEEDVPETLYGKLGRAEAIVNRYLETLLDNFSEEDRPVVGKILEAMVTEYHTKRRVTKAYLEDCIPESSRIDELLGKLVQNRIVRRSLGEYELIHDFLARRVLQLIDRKVFVTPPVRTALRFIEQNYQKAGLTSTDIAEAAGVSSVHLAALFRRQLGTTINRQVNVTRITAAKRLIGRSRDSLSAVASGVGFASLPSFSRRFSQLEGIPATAYRNSLPKTRRDGQSRLRPLHRDSTAA